MNQSTNTIPPPPVTGWTPLGWPAPVEPPPAPIKKSRKGYVIAGIAAFFIGAAIVGAASDQDSAGTTSGGATSVAAWARENQADLAAIVADSDAASSAAGRGSLTGLSNACASLERHVRTAQTHLPIPDAAVNAHYSDALRYYVLAAQSCQTGADNYDIDELTTSTHYLERATDALHQATAALP